MKYIKHYEAIEEDPQIGDYVICEEFDIPGYPEDINIKNFVNNHIGKYIENLEHNQEYSYMVQYDDVPKHIKLNFTMGEEREIIENARAMCRKEILYFSPNKEELKPYLQANKYNL